MTITQVFALVYLIFLGLVVLSGFIRVSAKGDPDSFSTWLAGMFMLGMGALLLASIQCLTSH